MKAKGSTISENLTAKDKTISTNRTILPCLFVLFSVIIEIVNFVYFGFRNVDGSMIILPKYFMFNLAIILIMAGVIFLCQNKVLQNVVYFFLISVQIILNIVNTTMYNIFGDIFSYDAIFLVGEAVTTLKPEYVNWWGAVINLVLLAVVIVTSVLMHKFNKTTFTYKRKFKWAIILAIFIASTAVGTSLLEIQKACLTTASAEESEIENSDEYLWENLQFKIDAYKKFGHFGFYTKTFINFFSTLVSNEDDATISAMIDDGYVEGDSSALLYGDNLMVVLCESLEWYAIDPILTPTLYSLAYGEDENAISFTNFYARNKTNISEGITLLGNMPRNNMLYQAKAKGYSFDYSLPKLFKSTASELDTKTQYVHMNNESFYKRNLTHGSNGIGFDELYTWEDYTGECNFSWSGCRWIEDYEFSSNQIDNIFPTDCDRFLTYYATLSTHGDWSYEQEYLKKYYSVIDENWSEVSAWMDENHVMGTASTEDMSEYDYNIFKHYKAGVIDFDKTVKLWLDELKVRGLADNTTIVFFADHNAYADNLCYSMRGMEKTDYTVTSANNIPMFIYSKKLASNKGSGINDTFCNTYDILPTICQLYGLPSNSMLFQGYSIYSEDIENSFFSSNLNGMFTNDIFSFNISEVYLQNESVSEEEIEKFKQNANKYYQKQEIFEKMYTNGINGTRKIA